MVDVRGVCWLPNTSEESIEQDSRAPGEPDAGSENSHVTEDLRLMELMIGEVQSQYDTTVSQINSHIQKSGLLLAFTSVLLMELFPFGYTPLCFMSVSLCLLSVIISIYCIILYMNIPMGIEVNEMSNLYCFAFFQKLVSDIYNFKTEALYDCLKKSQALSMLVLIQAVSFVLGLVAFIWWQVNI